MPWRAQQKMKAERSRIDAAGSVLKIFFWIFAINIQRAGYGGTPGGVL